MTLGSTVGNRKLRENGEETIEDAWVDYGCGKLGFSAPGSPMTICGACLEIIPVTGEKAGSCTDLLSFLVALWLRYPGTAGLALVSSQPLKLNRYGLYLQHLFYVASGAATPRLHAPNGTQAPLLQMVAKETEARTMFTGFDCLCQTSCISLPIN